MPAAEVPALIAASCWVCFAAAPAEQAERYSATLDGAPAFAFFVPCDPTPEPGEIVALVCVPNDRQNHQVAFQALRGDEFVEGPYYWGQLFVGPDYAGDGLFGAPDGRVGFTDFPYFGQAFGKCVIEGELRECERETPPPRTSGGASPGED